MCKKSPIDLHTRLRFDVQYRSKTTKFMNKISSEAQIRFDQLWQQATLKLQKRDISPAHMKHGQTDPVDYCLSTISRVIKQANPPLLAIRAIMNDLKSLAPQAFYYEVDSLHISLIGCSPRKATKTEFSAPQIENIQHLLSSRLPLDRPIQVKLRGIGLVGNQVFIQVFPIDRQWEALRQEIEALLTENHEHPISYPDKSPMHLNIMRLTSINSTLCDNLLAFINRNRNREIGTLEISSVEYLLTDFVVADIKVFQNFGCEFRRNP